MAHCWSRNCAIIFLVLVQLILFIQGAPKHHIRKETTDTKASKKSYIDIDASDPFKVPKSSHYVDKSMPDYEKEGDKPEGKDDIIENNPDENEPTLEENQPTLDENQGDNQEAPQQADEENNQQRNGLNSDLPASLTDQISQLADNKGSSNGSPIELNEKDIKSLLKNHDNGSEDGGEVQQEQEGN